MTKALTLYTNPMSRGRIIRWMLEEIGIDYNVKVLEYGTSMKSPEYLNINPMGKVPAIKHGNTIVTESPAICAYLAETFPDAKLSPLSDEERGAYYRWLFYAAGPLEQGLALKNIGITTTAEQEKMLGCGNIDKTIDVLAKTLSKSAYIAGDRFTAADVYVGSHIIWGLQFGTLEKTPEFLSYTERLISRVARQKAEQLDNALLTQ